MKKEMAQTIVRRANVLRENISELPLVIASQKQKIAILEKQLAALKSEPPSKESLEEADRDGEVMAVMMREMAYRQRYQRELALYANPMAESVQASLKLADQAAAELKVLKERKAADREQIRRQPRVTELGVLLDDAQRRLRDMEDKLRADQIRLVEAETEISKMPSDPAKVDIKAEKPPLVNPDATIILAQDDIFRDMAHNAATLRMDINSPKRVSVLQKASMPVQKDLKKQIIASVFAGLLGFGLVGLVVVGYEARAKKISSLSELKAMAPVPVAGVLPWAPGDAKTAPIVLESVDKLRSYVAQTWLNRGATTVAVTSPMGGEGKDYAAFALANSLAGSGVKTLLVDFDLKNPVLHTLAGVPNGSGVCELLRGEADFRGTIQRTAGGLHVLAAGQWSEEARSAAAGGRLESLLSRLKEPFDCVVLHANALLTAAESVEIARRCEVVLLCTLHRNTRTPYLKRAAERVAAMEVPYSGIVYLGATEQEALC
jgi:Mrp family chromosome partitioning ATPase